MVHTALNLNSVDWASLVHGQRQRGDGHHYVGMLRQRGGGLSGIIASIARMIPAFLGSSMGREMTNVGQSVLSDLQQGSDTVGSSLKRHARESVRRLTGLGTRRKRVRQSGAGTASSSEKAGTNGPPANQSTTTGRRTSKQAVAVMKPHSLPRQRRGRSLLLR